VLRRNRVHRAIDWLPGANPPAAEASSTTLRDDAEVVRENRRRAGA
jgi:hypothetical protein